MVSEMSELRNEVLQAEVAIRQLAEELAKAKGVTEKVAIVERKLNEAAKALEQSRKALEGTQDSVRETVAQAQASLSSAVENFRRVSDQLSQSSQALSSSVSQAIKDFGERVRQTLQQAYQNMQEQLITTVGEAQKALINAANSLMELRTDFERGVSALTQQNEQMLQRIAQQDVEIRKLSKWLKFCLVFVGLTTLASVTIIILMLIRQ